VVGLQKKPEHARVGRPDGQGPDRLGVPGLAERGQQPGHGSLIAGTAWQRCRTRFVPRPRLRPHVAP
jgi:hypothetical protein